MTLPRILAFEWAALFLLGLSLALGALLASNPFFAFPALLVWGLAAAGLVAGGAVAAMRDPLSPAQRVRSALAAPAAIGLLLPLGALAMR